MALEWAVKLSNQISGPAAAAKASLKGIEDQLKAVDRASKLDAHSKATGLTKQKLGLEIQRDDLKSKIEGPMSGLGGLGAALGPAGALAETLMKVATVAAAAAAAVAALGFAFSKAAFEAIAFRESTIGGLAIVLKSVTAAENVFKTGMNLALRFNLDPQATIASLHELVSKGFKPDDARIILTAMADLKVISPKANVDALILAMSQIKSKGVLQMEELQGQMAEAGLPIGKVLDQLAKKFGKTQMEIRKMISAGQISGDEGIFAIVAAIKDLGGGDLGASADKAAQSLSGMFNGIKFRAGMIGMKIADAVGDSAAVASVRDAMSSLLEASNPEKSPAMKSLIGAFSSLFTAMFGGMDALGGKGGTAIFSSMIAGIASGIETVAAAIAYVRPIAAAFLVGFGEGFSVLWAVMKGIGSVIWSVVSAMMGMVGGGSSMVSVAKNIGRVLGFLIGLLAIVAAVIIGVASAAFGFLAAVGAVSIALGTWLFDAINTALTALMDFGASAYEVGANIVQGIVNGIGNGIGLVTSIISSMGSAVIAQVISTFKIGSPSKVMAEMGGFVAEGMAVGIDDGSPDVSASMKNMVDIPSAESMKNGAAGAAGAGANVSVTVNVNGAGSNGEEIGATVAARVRQELVSFFDATGAEMGRAA